MRASLVSSGPYLRVVPAVVPTGWVTEGEAAFSEMSGSPPMSVHQQALRGIAQVLLERGERDKAKWQYEKILGKALMGRGPAEHWAHAEYGWMCFEDGDLQVGRAAPAAWEPNALF
jgi:hypothetical protein